MKLSGCFQLSKTYSIICADWIFSILGRHFIGLCLLQITHFGVFLDQGRVTFRFFFSAMAVSSWADLPKSILDSDNYKQSSRKDINHDLKILQLATFSYEHLGNLITKNINEEI